MGEVSGLSQSAGPGSVSAVSHGRVGVATVNRRAPAAPAAPCACVSVDCAGGDEVRFVHVLAVTSVRGVALARRGRGGRSGRLVGHGFHYDCSQRSVGDTRTMRGTW